MKKLLLYLTFCFSLSLVQSQSLNFATAITSSSSYSSILRINLDNQKNCYLSGWLKDSLIFDTGIDNTLANLSDYYQSFIAKYDSAGNYLWAYKLGNTNYCSIRDFKIFNDEFIITGNYYDDSLDINLGPDSFFIYANDGKNFIIKYDFDGNLIWHKTMNFCIGEITPDNSGNFYTYGYFEGSNIDFDFGTDSVLLTSNGSTDIFIAEYSSDWDLIWAKSIGGNDYEMSFNLKMAPAYDSFYICGNFSGTVDFDPDSGTTNLSASYGDFFYAKYNSNGNLIWAKNIGHSSSGTLYGSINLDPDNNIFITGGFDSKPDFDPGPASNTLTSKGYMDIFFSKYNNNGDYLWAKRIGGTGMESLANTEIDQHGNIIIAGYFWAHSGAVDFDPGSGSVLLSGNYYDIFLAKYNNNGNYVYAKNINGAGAVASESVESFFIDNYDDLYLAGGFFSDSININLQGNHHFLHRNGEYDFFIAKYNIHDLSIKNKYTTNNKLIFYPNPAIDYIYINETEKIKSLKIFNIANQLQFSTDHVSNPLYIGHLNPGIYFIQINDNSYKLIKQ